MPRPYACGVALNDTDTHIYIYIYIYVCICKQTYDHIYLSICLSICLSIYLSISLSLYVCMYIYIYIYIQDQTENLQREYSQWKETYILNARGLACSLQPSTLAPLHLGNPPSPLPVDYPLLAQHPCSLSAAS